MKKIFSALLISTIALSVNAQTKKPITPVKKTTVPAKKTTVVTKTIVKPGVAPKSFKSNLDSASYAFGFSMASQLKSGGLTKLNYEQMVAGLKDVFNDAKPVLTQEQCQTAINTLFTSFSAKREEQAKQQYMPAIKEGEEFLAKNKVKAGVKTTASGLQYEVITQGTGAMPLATDRVTVNYKGTLLDGTEFDSSEKQGKPITFGLNQVIKGWTEGVQLMQEGSKYRFFVPYNLAYGDRDMGQITPFSTLIFEVELVKIEK